MLVANNAADDLRDPRTYQIIGLAMGVHRDLGPGLNEEFYHRLLAERLSSADVPYQSKPRTELVYRGQVADVFEPDLIIPGRLVIELKAQRGGLIAEHLTQILCYMKFWGIPVGLLLDFAKERLIFQRVIRSEPILPSYPKLEVPDFVSDRGLANQIIDQIRRIYQANGLGYCDTTYQGLLIAAFRADSMPCTRAPLAQVGELGSASLRCLAIDNRCIVTVSALGDGLTTAERSITQTYLRLLKLTWGLEVHFGKRAIALQFVNRAACRPLAKSTPRQYYHTFPAVAEGYSI